MKELFLHSMFDKYVLNNCFGAVGSYGRLSFCFLPVKPYASTFTYEGIGVPESWSRISFPESHSIFLKEPLGLVGKKDSNSILWLI